VAASTIKPQTAVQFQRQGGAVGSPIRAGAGHDRSPADETGS